MSIGGSRGLIIVAVIASAILSPLRGTLKKCVNSQAVYPLTEQHGLKARERRYTAHEEGNHRE